MADANYYVDSTISSSGDGLAWVSAWKAFSNINWTTIANSVSAGDTVYINLKKGSTWNERLRIGAVGVSGRPITIRQHPSDTGAKPILKDETALVNTGWTDDGGGKYSKNIGSSVCYLMYEDSSAIPKAADATLANPASGPRWYFNSGTQVLYYATTGGDDPSNYTIAKSAIASLMDTTVLPLSYITIDGLYFYHGLGIYLVASNTPSAGGINNITIQNCDFIECNPAIYTQQRQDNFVQYINLNNNTFDYCQTNYYATVGTVTAGYNNDNIYVGYNTVTNSNSTPSGTAWQTSGDADGFGFQNLSNSTIEYNDISGSCYNSGGINVWNDTASTTDFTGNNIRYNYIHDVDNHGIVVDAGATDNSDHTCNVYFNIVNTFGASTGTGIRMNHKQTGSKIVNNSIYGGGIGLYLYSGPDYYNVKNNIVSNCTVLARADVVLNNNVLSNNCYHGGDSGTPFSISGVAKSWAQWTAAYTETDSITSDPLFVNATGTYSAATDFRLRKNSPCIDAGTDVGFTEDYEGTPIPS